MGRFKWLVVLLAVAVLFSACAKKQVAPVKEEPVPQVTPAPSPAPPPPVEQKPPVVEEKPIVLDDVFFDFDKYNIKDEYKSVLTHNAELLMANPTKKVLVEGHCDERGTAEYNMALGERRAKAVIDFYTAYGIKSNQLSWISYGEERPFDPGHTEAAWAKNRRAHMVLQ
jgi:peptidoglycan-associated lipoprotein